MSVHPLSKTFFEPDELAEVQALFDDVTSQPWFLAERKEDFARHMFFDLSYSPDDTVEERRVKLIAVAQKSFNRRT